MDLTGESAAALAGIDRGTADWLLDRLAAAHLLAEAESGRFGCHDLLHGYAGRLAAAMPVAERDAAAGRLVGWYLATAETAADLVHPDRLRLPPSSGDGPAAVPPAWEQPAPAVAWLDAERHNLVLVAQQAAGCGAPAADWQEG